MVHFEDLRQAAFNSQNDLNSYQAKQGIGKKSDSSMLCSAPSIYPIINT